MKFALGVLVGAVVGVAVFSRIKRANTESCCARVNKGARDKIDDALGGTGVVGGILDGLGVTDHLSGLADTLGLD